MWEKLIQGRHSDTNNVRFVACLDVVEAVDEALDDSRVEVEQEHKHERESPVDPPILDLPLLLVILVRVVPVV